MTRVREERPADRDRVFEIHAAAFGRRNEADLVVALREAADPQLSLVAVADEQVVGHVFFSPVQIPPPPLRTAGLAPLAVDPAHQGHGIGSALVRTGLERCPGLGWDAVFLVGSLDYYSRFGFRPAAPLGFRYGDPVFDPALQVAELRPGSLGDRAGLVRFHAAFAETGSG